MSRSEGFLGRWSRLKDEARRTGPDAPQSGEPAPDANRRGGAPPDEPGRIPIREARGEAVEREGSEPVDPDSLPSIESLNFDSDYTPFLRQGVPPELRKEALRRLWRSDPVLANLDGLLEYGEDYSAVGKTKSIVKTAYRVGRGMLHEEVSEREEPQPRGETDEPPAPAEGPEVASVEPPASDDPGPTDDDGPKPAGSSRTRGSGVA